MPADTAAPPQTVAELLSQPLRVGDPVISGPLAVAPVFGPEPKLRYVPFAVARTAGARIRELADGASVNDLIVENPTGDAVLLFEGEEVLGAQQNRTFDTTVLVAAGAKLRVPVSCVEAGRWDGSRHAEEFRPAPQTASPRLRGRKAEVARARVAMGAEARADQGEVWNEVAEQSRALGAHSPTGAMHDVFESRRGPLAEITAGLPPQEGQTGSIAFVDGRMWVTDLVSRPEAYATLHERLVQGYALDALAEGGAASATAPPEPETARGVALLIGDSPIAHRTPGTGLGTEIRFAANGLSGSGLEHEGELIQLSVFPQGPDGTVAPRGAAHRGRISRPSRRRT